MTGNNFHHYYFGPRYAGRSYLSISMPPCLHADSTPPTLHTSTSALQQCVSRASCIHTYRSPRLQRSSLSPHLHVATRTSSFLVYIPPCFHIPAVHIRHIIPPRLHVCTPAARLQNSR